MRPMNWLSRFALKIAFAASSRRSDESNERACDRIAAKAIGLLVVSEKRPWLQMRLEDELDGLIDELESKVGPCDRA